MGMDVQPRAGGRLEVQGLDIWQLAFNDRKEIEYLEKLHLLGLLLSAQDPGSPSRHSTGEAGQVTFQDT